MVRGAVHPSGHRGGHHHLLAQLPPAPDRGGWTRCWSQERPGQRADRRPRQHPRRREPGAGRRPRSAPRRAPPRHRRPPGHRPDERLRRQRRVPRRRRPPRRARPLRPRRHQGQVGPAPRPRRASAPTPSATTPSARLSEIDQTELWSTAARVRITEDELRAIGEDTRAERRGCRARRPHRAPPPHARGGARSAPPPPPRRVDGVRRFAASPPCRSPWSDPAWPCRSWPSASSPS